MLSESMEPGVQLNGNGFSMRDLMARSGLDLPKIGEVLTGEIISAGKNAIIVDLGPLGTGIVYPGEFYDNTDMQKSLKPGQTVSTILMDIENDEGYRELSLKRAQKTTSWENIRAKRDSGEIIETKITNLNKGGLIVELNGIQGFLPLSQLAPEHYPKVEGGDTTKIVQALQKMRGMDIKVKILDFSEQENRLIVSEKAVYEEQLKDVLAQFKVGDVVDAEVTEVTDFGAFTSVKIPNSLPTGQVGKFQIPNSEARIEKQGTEAIQTDETDIKLGVDGLIHISEIDWGLVENPRDFLKTGDVVKAKIIEISGGRLSLSIKQLKPNPWAEIEAKYSVGQTVEGEVAEIAGYGALVRLDSQVTGLIPLSEFPEQKIPDTLKLGDKLTVAIVSLDPKERKILLTLQK